MPSVSSLVPRLSPRTMTMNTVRRGRAWYPFTRDATEQTSWICSAQFRNLRNLEIAQRILRIWKLHTNLKIADTILRFRNPRTFDPKHAVDSLWDGEPLAFCSQGVIMQSTTLRMSSIDQQRETFERFCSQRFRDIGYQRPLDLGGGYGASKLGPKR